MAKDYVGGSWEDIRPHVEDDLRFGMIKQYANPLKKGDTVRIVGDVCQGLVGEIKMIEPNFYGIYLDSVEDAVFFLRDEIERVERALDTYSADELKDYLRGLYAIPLREIDGNDRDQMRECKRLLHAMGWEFVFKGGSNIAFRKIRTEWKKWK